MGYFEAFSLAPLSEVHTSRKPPSPQKYKPDFRRRNLVLFSLLRPFAQSFYVLSDRCSIWR